MRAAFRPPTDPRLRQESPKKTASAARSRPAAVAGRPSNGRIRLGRVSGSRRTASSRLGAVAGRPSDGRIRLGRVAGRRRTVQSRLPPVAGRRSNGKIRPGSLSKSCSTPFPRPPAVARGRLQAGVDRARSLHADASTADRPGAVARIRPRDRCASRSSPAAPIDSRAVDESERAPQSRWSQPQGGARSRGDCPATSDNAADGTGSAGARDGRFVEVFSSPWRGRGSSPARRGR